MIADTAALILLIGASAMCAGGLPESGFASLPSDEVQDVIFFGEARPKFFRFHIRIEGCGFRTAWANSIVRLHRSLDGNGDSVLTSEEARRGNLQQLLRNAFGPPRSAPLAKLDILDLNVDGEVSVDELMKYLRGLRGFDGLNIQLGLPPTPTGQMVFGLLDVDHDGVLSTDELIATNACIARHDLDEDELISLDEMKPFENPYSHQLRETNDPIPLNPESDDSSIVPLNAATAHPGIARRLLAHYDRP
jgi:hypothetical protein